MRPRQPREREVCSRPRAGQLGDLRVVSSLPARCATTSATCARDRDRQHEAAREDGEHVEHAIELGTPSRADRPRRTRDRSRSRKRGIAVRGSWSRASTAVRHRAPRADVNRGAPRAARRTAPAERVARITRSRTSSRSRASSRAARAQGSSGLPRFDRHRCPDLTRLGRNGQGDKAKRPPNPAPHALVEAGRRHHRRVRADLELARGALDRIGLAAAAAIAVVGISRVSSGTDADRGSLEDRAMRSAN